MKLKRPEKKLRMKDGDALDILKSELNYLKDVIEHMDKFDRLEKLCILKKRVDFIVFYGKYKTSRKEELLSSFRDLQLLVN